MTTRRQRPCSKPGCPELTTERFCAEHKSAGWESSHRGQSSTQRGYGAAWRRRRTAVLRRDNYLCQPCFRRDRLTEADEVDHIIPKHRGGTGDWDNLESICEDCHKAKSAREGHGRR